MRRTWRLNFWRFLTTSPLSLTVSILAGGPCYKILFFFAADATAESVTALILPQQKFLTLKVVLGRIHNTSFSYQLTNMPNKAHCLSVASLFWHIVVLRSRLLGQYISYDENEVLWIRYLASKAETYLPTLWLGLCVGIHISAYGHYYVRVLY